MIAQRKGKHQKAVLNDQLSKYPRKQPQRVNESLTKILVSLFNDPKGYSNIEIATGFTNLSRRRVIEAKNEYLQTGSIQTTIKNRQSKLATIKNKAMKIEAIKILTDNPYITLQALKNQLEKLNIPSSVTKLCRLLKQQKFTYKKLTYIPYSRNSDQVIRKRLQYCQEIKQISDQNLYFTDETSFNLKTAPNYGWSKTGQQASFKIADNAGETISVLAIINIKGLLSFSIIKGTAKTQNIQNNFKDNALPNIKDNAVLIMDNVRSHRSEEIMNFINQSGLKVKFLPPYSPQLNPIQNLFGTIKARFRRLRINRQVRTTNQLISTVKQVFQQQYGISMQNYYRNMRKYVQLGLLSKPFDKNL